MASRSVEWSSLPSDILAQVIAKVDSHDRTSVRLTCRYADLGSDHFWHANLHLGEPAVPEQNAGTLDIRPRRTCLR